MATPLPTTSAQAKPTAALFTDAERWWQRFCEQPNEAIWWDWFALLRRIQCVFANDPPLGCGVTLGEDPIRLGQIPFLNHPATVVARFEPGQADADAAARPRLYSYHFGLFGPDAPLPTHLTELAHLQRLSGDPALAAFCDIFHHRFLSLFFRAWAVGRKEIALDRSADDTDRDDWEVFVGAMCGIGLASFRNRDRFPDHAKLYHAGRLLLPVRNAEGLQAILHDYFQVEVSIIEFYPRQLPIPTENGCTLGVERTSGSLGRSLFIGETLVDNQEGFRICLGPLDFAQFEDFLPGGDGYAELCDWVRFYCGRHVDGNPECGMEPAWDLQLLLLKEKVPGLILDGERQGRLGYSTWLCSESAEEAGVVVIVPRGADNVHERVRGVAAPIFP